MLLHITVECPNVNHYRLVLIFLFLSVWNPVTHHCDEQEFLQACASREGHTGLISETATARLASLGKITRQGHIQCLQRLDYQQGRIVSDDLWVVHRWGLHPSHMFTLAVPTPIRIRLCCERAEEENSPSLSLPCAEWVVRHRACIFFYFTHKETKNYRARCTGWASGRNVRTA